MKRYARAVLAIVWKELRMELRTREVVVTTGMFAVLVAVLTSVSFYTDPVGAPKLAPGVLWISITFAGILAMSRSWAREREFEAFQGVLLTPMPRSAFYVGKLIGVLVLLGCVEVILVPLVAVLFHADFAAVLGPLLALLLLGTLGFTATGTLFSAMTVRTRARDLMLSIVVFPLVAPALIASVVATRETLGGASLAEIDAWIRILAAFDLVALGTGVTLFDTLVSD